MKVTIDQNKCQGHGMCLLASPEIFALSDEDGHAYLLRSDIPSELEDAAAKAVQSCPEQAIRLTA